MKAHRYLISILILLVSCEMRFELDMAQEEPKLYVFCLPGAEDTTAIIIDVARPAGSANPYDWTKAEVDFRINGERQEVVCYSDRKYWSDLPSDCFYTTAKALPSDKVSLSVTLGDLKTATASDVMPQLPKDVSFTIKHEEGSNSGSADFIIEYTDNSDESCYAVVFREKEHYYDEYGYEDIPGYTEVVEYTNWQFIFNDYEYDPFMSNPELNRNVFNNNAGLYFWSNSDVLEYDGRRKVVLRQDIQYDIYYHERHYFDFSYEARVYRISQDLFDFYNTGLLAQENSLKYMGMARGNSTSTNISNGFGILGGMAGCTLMYDTTYSHDDKYLPEPGSIQDGGSH